MSPCQCQAEYAYQPRSLCVSVPLKSISVEVRVRGFVADVSSTLQYKNKESSPVEAVFVFPMEGSSAVYRFSARIGGVEIEAEVRDKQEAWEQYDDALSSGQQAFLLEESDESPDVFRLSVGSLAPGESASVSLFYATELPVQEDRALRFCLPAVLNPRYTPVGSASITADLPRASGGSVPYSLSLSVHITSPSAIDRVQCSCPISPLEYLTQDKTQAKLSLSPGHKFDRDVELLVYYCHAHQPTAILEAGLPSASPGTLMADPMLMLSLFPEFPTAVSTLSSNGEFIFLMDCSGSMQNPMDRESGAQQRIESARDTLVLLLKSLPLGCHFNIYSFGSQYESFFPESVEYTQDSMESALKKVMVMQADMGGTEILFPLREIYRKPCQAAHPRQLFVFTDGEVSNTKEVIDLVRSHAFSHRCFTFGIGEGASSSLITGMARAGSGHPQFITGTDRLQPKVMQSLRFALQPVVKEISVCWDVPPGIKVSLLSPSPTVLFRGQRALLYAQLTGQCDSSAVGSVCLQYTLGDKSVKNELSFSLNSDMDSGLAIHRLGACTLIRFLEGQERERTQGKEKEVLKQRLIKLSTESGVSCSHTAFIAINKDNKQPVQGALLCRDIPGKRVEFEFDLKHSCLLPSTERIVQEKTFAVDDRSYTPNYRAACFYDPYASSEPGSMHKFSLSKYQNHPKHLSTLLPSLTSSSLNLDLKCLHFSKQHVSKPKEDPMLMMITLQKANGSWELNKSVASVLGKTKKEVTGKMPKEALNTNMWATVLALLWLYGFKLDFKDEWHFVAMKAVSWIKSQSGVDVTRCVEAGNILLGCQVDPRTLGI
ncbi:VMA5A protein, partial [Atractosteus spatula]|nr:VMA5A protein [Atractosteus spatula]